MFRSFILLIAVGLVVWLISRMLKNKKTTGQSKPDNSRQHEIKKIVQCQQCQVFVPEDKAIKSDQFAFCSQQHLDQWQQEH
ncbi:MAG: PP0621 family protein [Gammaproteobacteria bacterium]|nr:PP0621 family protein [Gammaproteobacteria bacterium]